MIFTEMKFLSEREKCKPPCLNFISNEARLGLCNVLRFDDFRWSYLEDLGWEPSLACEIALGGFTNSCWHRKVVFVIRISCFNWLDWRFFPTVSWSGDSLRVMWARDETRIILAMVAQSVLFGRGGRHELFLFTPCVHIDHGQDLQVAAISWLRTYQ